jgi:hypothetical protein
VNYLQTLTSAYNACEAHYGTFVVIKINA